MMEFSKAWAKRAIPPLKQFVWWLSQHWNLSLTEVSSVTPLVWGFLVGGNSGHLGFGSTHLVIISR